MWAVKCKVSFIKSKSQSQGLHLFVTPPFFKHSTYGVKDSAGYGYSHTRSSTFFTSTCTIKRVAAFAHTCYSMYRILLLEPEQPIHNIELSCLSSSYNSKRNCQVSNYGINEIPGLWKAYKAVTLWIKDNIFRTRSIGSFL